jgi:putative addiction module component (TIGR02574 family)
LALPLTELEIEDLTVSQRLELIGLLWDSIPESEEARTIPEWHLQELQRRLEQADAHPGQAISWEQVKARLGEKP